MNQITTVGADLAKEVIVACAADATGRVLFLSSYAARAEWSRADRRHPTVSNEGDGAEPAIAEAVAPGIQKDFTRATLALGPWHTRYRIALLRHSGDT